MCSYAHYDTAGNFQVPRLGLVVFLLFRITNAMTSKLCGRSPFNACRIYFHIKEIFICVQEHIVWTWDDKTPEFHNRLVSAYRDKVLELMDEGHDSLPEGTIILQQPLGGFSLFYCNCCSFKLLLCNTSTIMLLSLIPASHNSKFSYLY